MKTLAKKNKAIIRWIVIVAVCYLLASAGVNQVINPYYYFHREQAVELSVSFDEAYMYIDLFNYSDKGGFLTISVEDMNTFSVGVKARIVYENEETEEKTINIGNVINCYNLQRYGDGVKQIVIPQESLKEADMQIGAVVWSQHRQVNTLQMVLVFFSFLCLVVFYSFMQWIKKKYAK